MLYISWRFICEYSINHLWGSSLFDLPTYAAGVKNLHHESSKIRDYKADSGANLALGCYIQAAADHSPLVLLMGKAAWNYRQKGLTPLFWQNLLFHIERGGPGIHRDG